jgi:hypothetical protein
MAPTPIANIVEAYEHAYDTTWDRKEPPTARELAVFCPDDESPAAAEEKLKEFCKLREFQIFGPGGNTDPIDIRKDSTFQKLKEQVRPKLKEMALSDEAYAVAEINRIVWEALKPNLAFRELVTIWHTDRPTYRFIRAILVPRAFDIQEATEIPIAGEKYDYIDVNMRKIGIRPEISREMVEDAQWDVVARQIAEGGRAMAQKENELGLAVLNTQATSSNNYQGYGSSVNSATSGSFVYNDVVNLIQTLRGQNAFPDTLFVNPTEEGSLLKDTTFINAFYFGGLMKKALGPAEFFGQMLGFRTLTSTLQTSGTPLMLDTARAAGFVIRRDVTVEHLIDPNKDLSGAAFTSRINLGICRHMAVAELAVTH